jgi:phosphatidylglycerophosphate synthase
MVDRWLRVPKERILEPVAQRLVGQIAPNVVTIAACGIGLLTAGAAWAGLYGVAVGLWIVNRLLDGLDGSLARAGNRQTDFGGYLDILLDTVVYAAIPLGLALAANTSAAYLALAVLLASFYINGASWMYLAALLEKRAHGATAQRELTTITMPHGLIEGAETIVLYTLFLLFPGWIVPLFGLMAALVMVTVVQRMRWTIKSL